MTRFPFEPLHWAQSAFKLNSVLCRSGIVDAPTLEASSRHWISQKVHCGLVDIDFEAADYASHKIVEGCRDRCHDAAENAVDQRSSNDGPHPEEHSEHACLCRRRNSHSQHGEQPKNHSND
jgi:hypothetical protein